MKNKLLFASMLVIALALQLAPVNAQQKTEKQKNDTRVDMISGESQINFSEDGHRYRIRLSGSKITEMYVDDKKVAEEDYGKYDAMVKKILIQVEKDRKQAEKDREQADRDRQQADKDREQADKDREQAEKDRQQADKDRAHAEEDRKHADKEREQADHDRKQADKDREQAEKDREQADRDREQAGKDRQQAELDRIQAEEDRKLMEEMIDEVVKEKLIENRTALKSLVLDDKEFTVNGVKQPDNLHSKFKTKYLKGSHSRISYRNTNGYRGTSFE